MVLNLFRLVQIMHVLWSQKLSTLLFESTYNKEALCIYFNWKQCGWVVHFLLSMLLLISHACHQTPPPLSAQTQPHHARPSSWASFGSTNFCSNDSDSAGTRDLASSTQLPCLSSITFSCRFNVFCSLFPQGLIKIFREKKHIRLLYLQGPDDAPLLLMMR